MPTLSPFRLAFVDLETTGLDPDKHEIVELGCIVVEQKVVAGKPPQIEVVSEFEYKIKPEHIELADPEALQINGYNSADWLFAVDLPQALKVFAEKTVGAIMVAQNVTFDYSFLRQAFAKTGVTNRMGYHRFDLVSMAFIKLSQKPEVTRFSLRALADYFQIKNERAHTALSDTRVALEIYKKLLTS